MLAYVTRILENSGGCCGISALLCHVMDLGHLLWCLELFFNFLTVFSVQYISMYGLCIVCYYFVGYYHQLEENLMHSCKCIHIYIKKTNTYFLHGIQYIIFS